MTTPSSTPSGGSAGEGAQPREAIQSALECLNSEVKLWIDKNTKLTGELSQVRKELEEKEEALLASRRDLDILTHQLSPAGSSDLERELEEGRKEIERLKADLVKAKESKKVKDRMTGRMTKAFKELLKKHRQEKGLQRKFGETKKELRKVRMNCRKQLGALKTEKIKEKKLKADFQRVQDELGQTKEELIQVRKQLEEEEELRMGSETKLRSITDSVNGILRAGPGGLGDEGENGSIQSSSQGPGGQDSRQRQCHRRQTPVTRARRLGHGEDHANPLHCLCAKGFQSQRRLKDHIAYFKRKQRIPFSKRVGRTRLAKPKSRRRSSAIRETYRANEDLHGSVDVPPATDASEAGPSASSSSREVTTYFCKCGQQFASNSLFLEHMLQTELKGRFKCCWCTSTFGSRQLCGRHLKTFHRMEGVKLTYQLMT